MGNTRNINQAIATLNNAAKPDIMEAIRNSLSKVFNSTKQKTMEDKVVKIEDQTLGHGPWPKEGLLRIVLISDTHMQHQKLVMPQGDLLIHAGDFTNRGRAKEIKEFDDWLGGLNYQYKVVVYGNHDTETDILAITSSGRGKFSRNQGYQRNLL